jgi:hypothetical protein
MSTGIELIIKERERQINEEGWTPEHDAEHTNGGLALAAACYASPVLLYEKHEYAKGVSFEDPWPWSPVWDKRPGDGNTLRENSPMYVNRDERLKQLAKAGALIAAEIDRIVLAKEQKDGNKK